MSNDQLARLQRHLYLKGAIAHQDYYLWLADLLHVNTNHLLVTEAEILASQDEYFNDIPLRKWELSHYRIAMKAEATGIGWSLSDTVCVMKALAQKVKDAYL